MKKKVLASVLAMSMVFGTALSVQAADSTIKNPDDTGVYGAELEGSSTAQVPTIEVVVPGALSGIVINPYEMGVDTDTDGTDDTWDSVISVPGDITNKSNVPISVNIASLQAKADEGSEAVIAATAPTDKITTKSVFLYMELKDENTADWQASYNAKNATQLIVGGTKASTKLDVIKLEAGDQGETKANFKIAGSVASKPAKAWASTDTVTLSVKFTFTPQIAGEPKTGA